MRFTLDLSHRSWTRGHDGHAAARTLEIARAADAAGIDAIWVSEDPEGWDAFALLGAIAAVTSGARLGTSVTSPYPRHPNLLAASVATLDRLSAGRAVLGLGRGQTEWHRDGLGIDTGEPLGVLKETIALLRGWWAPPHRASSPDGAHFRVRGWEREVHPVQAHVPILLAAAGPRALALASEAADGVIFNILTAGEFLGETIPRLRESAAAAGRDPDALWFVLRTPIDLVTDNESQRRAIDRAKTIFALVATLPGMDRLVTTADFDVPAILDEVRAMMGNELVPTGGFPSLRRHGDLAAARQAIPDGLIHRLGIVGPPATVRARIASLARMGVTHVAVTPPREAASAEAWGRLLADLRQ